MSDVSLEELLEPYGGDDVGLWRLLAHRPDIAEALAPAMSSYGTEDDIRALQKIRDAHRDGADEIVLRYPDGRADVITPGRMVAPLSTN